MRQLDSGMMNSHSILEWILRFSDGIETFKRSLVNELVEYSEPDKDHSSSQVLWVET